MILYRIEKDGVGPWLGYPHGVYTYRNAVGEDGHDPGSLPGPQCNGERGTPLSRHTDAHVFACASVEQVLQWFPDAHGRKAMADVGYKLRVYEAPEDAVLLGRYQVAALKSKLQLQQELELTEIAA